MGKVDRATKSYLTQSSVFADIFNFYLYEGQQVIDPGQLRELDPAELSMPYGTDRKGEPVQRYRDLFKALSAMGKAGGGDSQKPSGAEGLQRTGPGRVPVRFLSGG